MQYNDVLLTNLTLSTFLFSQNQASYGVEDAEFAITQLAQTTMRAEIGQMTLDRTLAERAHLNANIVDAINSASEDWGIQCLRYEIRKVYYTKKKRLIDQSGRALLILLLYIR